MGILIRFHRFAANAELTRRARKRDAMVQRNPFTAVPGRLSVISSRGRVQAPTGAPVQLPEIKNATPEEEPMRFYEQHHQFYCGVDLDARSMYLCIQDDRGSVLFHKNLPTDRRGVARYFIQERQRLESFLYSLDTLFSNLTV